jgi:hypothetical protein
MMYPNSNAFNTCNEGGTAPNFSDVSPYGARTGLAAGGTFYNVQPGAAAPLKI